MSPSPINSLLSLACILRDAFKSHHPPPPPRRTQTRVRAQTSKVPQHFFPSPTHTMCIETTTNLDYLHIYAGLKKFPDILTKRIPEKLLLPSPCFSRSHEFLALLFQPSQIIVHYFSSIFFMATLRVLHIFATRS